MGHSFTIHSKAYTKKAAMIFAELAEIMKASSLWPLVRNKPGDWRFEFIRDCEGFDPLIDLDGQVYIRSNHVSFTIGPWVIMNYWAPFRDTFHTGEFSEIDKVCPPPEDFIDLKIKKLIQNMDLESVMLAPDGEVLLKVHYLRVDLNKISKVKLDLSYEKLGKLLKKKRNMLLDILPIVPSDIDILADLYMGNDISGYREKDIASILGKQFDPFKVGILDYRKKDLMKLAKEHWDAENKLSAIPMVKDMSSALYEEKKGLALKCKELKIKIFSGLYDYYTMLG